MAAKKDKKDQRIVLIDNYIERITHGKIKGLKEEEEGTYKIEFRVGTAKINVEVYLKEDMLNIRSTLMEINELEKEQKLELFEEILRINSSVESGSAKFGLTDENFIEVLVSRKDLKDLDYSEFISALKNVCHVADKKGGEIIAKYTLGDVMDITPLDDEGDEEEEG